MLLQQFLDYHLSYEMLFGVILERGDSGIDSIIYYAQMAISALYVSCPGLCGYHQGLTSYL